MKDARIAEQVSSCSAHDRAMSMSQHAMLMAMLIHLEHGWIRVGQEAVIMH